MNQSITGRYGHVVSDSEAGPNEQILTDHEWNVICESLHLSERESQIVRGMLADESERAIARRLGISKHTVHTHVERLYRKLRITSRGQLFRRILRAYIDLFAGKRD